MSDRYRDAIAREDAARGWPTIPFEVGMVLVALVLCVLYALLFSRMIYDSVMEHVLAPAIPLRYAGPPHVHHPLEWAWLLSGAVIGWLGTFASLRFLIRRWSRR